MTDANLGPDLEEVLKRIALSSPHRASVEGLLRRLVAWSVRQPGVRHRPNSGMHPRLVFEHPSLGILWKVHAGDRKDLPKIDFIPSHADGPSRSDFLDAVREVFPGLAQASKPVLSVPLTMRFTDEQAEAIEDGLKRVLPL